MSTPAGTNRAFKTVYSCLEYLAVAIIVLIFFVPIAWIVLTAFKPSQDVYTLKLFFTPTLANFRAIFSYPLDFGPYLLNSFIVTTATLVIGIPISLFAAYSLSRFKIAGKQGLLFWILSTQFIPPVIIALPFFILFRNLGLLDTRISLIIVNLCIIIPFAIWLIKGFLDGIPTDIEEAALIDGCSRFGVLTRIIVALAKPGILTATVFCFVLSWNEFMFPLILSRQNATTLPVALMLLNAEKGVIWEQMAAAGIVLVIPSVILVLLVRKHFVQGLTLGALD
ncbi:MAG: carbohydrate ABC transporter permease [Peptococcaceae bacterium]|nr:carbohydrate ABC transporter permease [Peptococcaceae bacterium]